MHVRLCTLVVVASSLLPACAASETNIYCDGGYVSGDTCLCYPGFSGEGCTVECGGSDTGSMNDVGVCECQSPYSGVNCEVVCNGHGHLDLTSNACVCDTGYSGTNCERMCSDHGQLRQSGECACDPGYTGNLCEDECSNVGTFDPSIGKCRCVPPWGGLACDVKCNGRGDSADLSSFCLCQDGFSGPTCEVECSGHGRMDGGVCVCSPLRSGTFCEIECNNNGHINMAQGTCVCENPLLTDPECYETPPDCGGVGVMNTTSNQCMCPPGLTGPSCQTVVLNCEHGVERAGACVCDVGYSGDRCQLECAGHGSLSEDADSRRCVCDDMWAGAVCNVSCHGRGTVDVENNRCDCVSDHFTGRVCEVECSGHGQYDTVQQKCVCQTTFGGDFCQIPCSGVGELVTIDGEQACACRFPYSGDSCEIACNGIGELNATAHTCRCPALLGGQCDEVCSSNGMVRVDIRGANNDVTQYILPSEVEEHVFAVAGGSNGMTLSSEELVKAVLDRSWPSHWDTQQSQSFTVETARCTCADRAYTGPRCETECGGHGTVPQDTTLDQVYTQLDDCLENRLRTDTCLNFSTGAALTCRCTGVYGTVAGQCVRCSGRGEYDAINNKCKCTEEGYVGPACNKACNGHGRLNANGVCNCNHHISGDYCEEACDWLCKGGHCNGEVCECMSGFQGQWCDSTCYTRDGASVCEQVIAEDEVPLRNRGWTMAWWMVALTYLALMSASLVCAVILRKYLCVYRAAAKRRTAAQNRSRYMSDRGSLMTGVASDDVPPPEGPVSINLREEPVYESYDNPNAFSSDRRVDDFTNQNVDSDSDEVEIDLHSEQFRSS